MNTVPPNRRLLLIDDNPSIHEDFKKILAGPGDLHVEYFSAKSLLFGDESDDPSRVEFDIDSAFQGQQGLQMVERAAAEGRPYAMAFVDVRMPPGWDGIETIARIWETHPDLQVVICTAYSDYSWGDIQKQFGNSDSLLILKKPFDNVEVLQLAHALTAKWNLTRAASLKIEQLDKAVTERTRELQRSEERFAKAFQKNPLPMFIEAATDGRVLDANVAFLNLINGEAKDVFGRTTLELNLWANDEVAAVTEVLTRPNQHPGAARIRTRSGEERNVILFAEEFQIGIEPCRLVLLQDETKRLKLESDLRQAQKMEAVGQLAAGVAHDFNNILTIIQGQLSLVLGRNEFAPATDRALKQALTASERAGTLTRQLLAFSRKQVMERKPLQLHTLFEQTEAMIARLIGDDIEVEMNCHAALPPVFGDRCNLEQVILNLAVNARDAMPSGGKITITAAERPPHLNSTTARASASAGRFVCLRVQDTGTGMDELTKAKIFEPFYTTKAPGKGTGMGLATVYGIVKQHEGWIEVESVMGQGTTFHVYLPVSAGVVPVNPVHASSEINHEGHETILAVEDEPMVLEFVQEVLTSHGYRVISVLNAVEALKVWEQEAGSVSLLLTDMVMPGGVTGKQLAEKLKAQKPELRIVFSSGYSLDLLEQKVLAPGEALLQKPYPAALLVKTVRNCLDAHGDKAGQITDGWRLNYAAA